MKRFFQIATRTLSGCLFIFVACLLAWSYHAPHSVRCSQASGEIQVLTDRGILQIDLVRGDTEDRGFEWDAHRRSAAWGRAVLEMWKPKAGFGKLWADLGFASWPYDRHLHGLLSPSLPGRAILLPLWFLALVVVSPVLIEVIVVLTRRRSNKPDAANPAITLRFHAGSQWRGVADPFR
jgi:hypothetical protein